MRFQVGLQLYTLREELEKNFVQTLEAVQKCGYDWVEFAGYFGRSASEIRHILDDLGLRCVSVHQNYESFLGEEGKKNAEFVKNLGAQYAAIPWMGREKHKGGSENFEKTVREITEAGKTLAEFGLLQHYHNHDFEFQTIEGRYLLDYLYEAVDPQYLAAELDVCWVHYAGVDPVEMIQKYHNRGKILHLKDYYRSGQKSGAAYKLIDANGKDMESQDAGSSTFEFRPLGQGCVPLERVIRAAENTDITYLVVEQDQCPTASPLESVAQSRKYLHSLGI